MSVITDREIAATRVIGAPRERVFEMWTDPGLVTRWWGPRGFTSTLDEMDVRPGGAWRFVMHGPDGVDYNNRSVYVEVVRPERLVYDHVSGPQFRMAATFAEHGGETTLSVRMLFESAAQRDKVAREFGAVAGLHQTLDRLEEALAGEATIVITRVLDAPRPLVFQAWTEPDRMMRWWGPNGFTLPACTVDLRPGGGLHFCMRSPEGQDFWCRGEYREVVAPSRIVVTDCFADEAGNPVPPTRYGMSADWPAEALLTLTFAEHGAGTQLTLRHAVGSAPAAEREMCRQGWSESLDRLAACLAPESRSGSATLRNR